MSPDYGAALPPTPHPLADLLGLVATPLGDGAITVTMVDRLRVARPDRLPRLPARLALVRPPDRRRRGADRPHPGALPLQRPARLRRPPLHRPLPRRAGDRDRRPRAGWPVLALLALGRPAAPRGLALLRSPTSAYLALGRRRGADRARRAGSAASTGGSRAPASRPASASCVLARRAWRSPAPVALGALRLDHRRQPDLLVHRHPGNGRDARPPDRPGRPRPLRAAPARRGAAVAGDGRRRSAASSSASPSCAAARRSASPPRSLALGAFAILACAGLAIIPRYTMLAAAVLAIFVAARPARLAAARARPPLAAALAGLRRRWSSLMFVVWAPEPVRPRSTGSTPTSPTRRGSRATSTTSPTPAPSSRSAGRSRCPTTARSPASPSTSTSADAGSSAPASSASRGAATSSTRRAPSSIHNFILDPNDPARFTLAVPPGFRRVAAQRVLGPLPALSMMPDGDRLGIALTALSVALAIGLATSRGRHRRRAGTRSRRPLPGSGSCRARSTSRSRPTSTRSTASKPRGDRAPPAPPRPQGHLLSRRRHLGELPARRRQLPADGPAATLLRLPRRALARYPPRSPLLAPILRKRLRHLQRARASTRSSRTTSPATKTTTGFPLSGADQLRFNRWVAREVHRRGMAVALKNDPDQVGAAGSALRLRRGRGVLRVRRVRQVQPLHRRRQGGLRGRVRGSPAELLPAGASTRLQRDRQGLRPLRRALAAAA